MKTDWKLDLAFVLKWFLSSRILLIVIGFLSWHWLRDVRTYNEGWNYSSRLWLDIWGLWDTGWYLSIVREGYHVATSLDDLANIAFFPLYPLLIWLVSLILGNDYFVALLVSNLCFIVAAVLLLRLVREIYGQNLAGKTIRFLFLFPVSYVFSGAFTESLFLLLAVSCFYFLYRKEYWGVTLTGILASATKLMGVFLIIPILFELWLVAPQQTKAKIKKSFIVCLMPLGAISFWFYVFSLTGNFWAIIQVEREGWDHGWANPVWSLAQSLFHHKIGVMIAGWVSSLVLILLFLKRKLINASWFVFGLMSVLIPLLTTPVEVFGFVSMPRYIVVVFPIYVLLAKMSEKKGWNIFLTAILPIIQIIIFVFWVNGFEVAV